MTNDAARAEAPELHDARIAIAREDALREAVRAVMADALSLALDLRGEVERGMAMRQSAESKLARADVAESIAASLRRALAGGGQCNPCGARTAGGGLPPSTPRAAATADPCTRAGDAEAGGLPVARA